MSDEKRLTILTSDGQNTIEKILRDVVGESVPEKETLAEWLTVQTKEIEKFGEEALRSLAADAEFPGFDGKYIPYLGWFWREWGGVISEVRPGKLAIDGARKWDYPTTNASDEDREFINQALVDIGRKRIEIVARLAKYVGKATPE